VQLLFFAKYAQESTTNKEVVATRVEIWTKAALMPVAHQSCDLLSQMALKQSVAVTHAAADGVHPQVHLVELMHFIDRDRWPRNGRSILNKWNT
jgi:wobble nucleotide-excising tRNase